MKHVIALLILLVAGIVPATAQTTTGTVGTACQMDYDGFGGAVWTQPNTNPNRVSDKQPAYYVCGYIRQTAGGNGIAYWNAFANASSTSQDFDNFTSARDWVTKQSYVSQ